jgi:hypothetical protein
MVAYQDPRTAPKPEVRRVTEKPTASDMKPRRPAPEPAPKPVFTDWAMI